jgi:group I intron endonuclease
MFGQTHSYATKSKMSDSKKGSKNPMFGKPKVVGSGSPSQKISVLDKDNNQSTTYDSINAAARALNIPKSSINHFLANNPQKPYKCRYILKKKSTNLFC